MIPKRQGFADIGMTIPTGNGQLPPLPDAVPPPPAPQVQAEAPSFKPGDLLEALNIFSKVSKIEAVNQRLFKALVDKKLVVVCDEYAVVSEKGLKALVDFVL